MIDTLYQQLPRIKQPDIWSEMKLKKGNYFLMTLHRPSNVDNVENLQVLLDVILENTGDIPLIFPVHPRTKKILSSVNYAHEKLITLEPMGYLEFIYMVKNAKAIITDSGGITEEATVLKVPCLTLRDSTERPETVTIGTNELVGRDPLKLIPFLNQLKNSQWKESAIPPLWDGKTATRIVAKLMELYSKDLPLKRSSIKAMQH
jgi:UDP-N-acetylglucosamine 2-epimerase (non-hydrolysing)